MAGYSEAKYWLPEILKDAVKISLSRFRHRQARIYSPYVSSGAILSKGVLISHDVEIADGVKIGPYSYINARSIVTSGTIGSFVSVGYSCQIGLPTHPTRQLSTSPFIYSERNIVGAACQWEDYSSPPVIGHDVWVCSNALILQRVTVGNGAIVMAGAVVTKDVPDYGIVAGVPARLVGRRFDDETCERLNAFRWWDKALSDPALLRGLVEAREQFCQALAQPETVSGIGNDTAERIDSH